MACSNCDCKAAEDIFPPKDSQKETIAYLQDVVSKLESRVEIQNKRLECIEVFLTQKHPEELINGIYRWYTKREFDRLAEERKQTAISVLVDQGYVVSKPEPETVVK